MSPAKSKIRDRKSKMKLKQHNRYYHQNQYIDSNPYNITSKERRAPRFHDGHMDPATLEAHVEAATVAASAAVAAEMANSNCADLQPIMYPSSSKTDKSSLPRLFIPEIPLSSSSVFPDENQMQAAAAAAAGVKDLDMGNVKQEDLQLFLESIPNFHNANIVRGGRCVKSGFVQVVKGENYLRDMFYSTATTSHRNIIVVRETLYCSGRGNCLRACGGRGQCVEGCTRTSERVTGGHSCFFQVKLSMYSASLGTWRVKIQGSHDGPVDYLKNSLKPDDEMVNRNQDFITLDPTHPLNCSANELMASQADAIADSVPLKSHCHPLGPGVLPQDVGNAVNGINNGDTIENCKSEMQSINDNNYHQSTCEGDYQSTCDGSCHQELERLRQENTALKLELLQLQHAADNFKLLEDLKELIRKYEKSDSLPTSPPSPAMYLMKLKNENNEYVTITQP